MNEVWNTIAKQGSFGLALIACIVVITSVNDNRNKEYEARLEQAKQERQELMQIIEKNTVASEQLSQAIREMLQRLR